MIDQNCGHCHRCLQGVKDASGVFAVTATRMILCRICGNKRCPHATDHTLACTASNEPGQGGSIYGPTPSLKPMEALQ